MDGEEEGEAATEERRGELDNGGSLGGRVNGVMNAGQGGWVGAANCHSHRTAHSAGGEEKRRARRGEETSEEERAAGKGSAHPNAWPCPVQAQGPSPSPCELLLSSRLSSRVLVPLPVPSIHPCPCLAPCLPFFSPASSKGKQYWHVWFCSLAKAALARQLPIPSYLVACVQ